LKDSPQLKPEACVGCKPSSLARVAALALTTKPPLASWSTSAARDSHGGSGSYVSGDVFLARHHATRHHACTTCFPFSCQAVTCAFGGGSQCQRTELGCGPFLCHLYQAQHFQLPAPNRQRCLHAMAHAARFSTKQFETTAGHRSSIVSPYCHTGPLQP
jgi:hypothetical protein